MTIRMMEERAAADREAQNLVNAIQRTLENASEAEIRAHMPEVVAAREARGCLPQISSHPLY